MEPDRDTAAGRFDLVAGAFSDVVAGVPDTRWTAAAPCEGWTARDVVAHLVEWVPSVLSRAGLDFPARPTVEEDPAGAWAVFCATIRTALHDPTVAGRSFDAGPPGEMTVEQAVDRLVVGDVLVHTWDLARATGLEAGIDEDLAAGMLAGLQPIDDLLRSSGHYGPAVEVPSDADVVTRLIAFTGRDPDAGPSV